MRRYINNKSQITDLCVRLNELLDKGRRNIPVEVGKSLKTHEQLGYLHAEVLPKLAEALFEAGEIRSKSEGHAKYYLKRLIGYGNYYTFGDSVVFDPDSFMRATVETLNQAIDTALEEAAKRGIYIAPPRSHGSKA